MKVRTLLFILVPRYERIIFDIANVSVLLCSKRCTNSRRSTHNKVHLRKINIGKIHKEKWKIKKIQ